MKKIKLFAAVAALTVAGTALAQTVATPAPQNVLQLMAAGTVEVQQDLLSMTLSTTRDATDAATVQTQLKTALDAALAEAKKTAQPGQLDVRTGNFSLSPRYTKDGKINGWQGSTELVLEGRDFPRITQAAGRVTTLTVGSVGFGLSREQRAKTETEAQNIAIENFKQKATELAKGFGFGGYTLREVSVNANDSGPIRPRMMAAQAKSFSSDSAVPVEAGKTSVVVNVSGSVQLK
ncbi:Predicted secreted protein [Variovorax sp. OK605]|uniref:SIMPL domain-containing protein n=1 Tax=unclassified Variovorax TaxID=663243 RepID=UPI0008B99ABA|nr:MULTISPECIES: SIMPL domain-containing protein [unclassified Variovorax]SEK04007.1 Predicted secreted protein [Variovorax sp. OK202]SFD38342.1 Predicted secreted protein [Variovorax sp. OK212]SFP77098.1 Predicted secreted protein [Variovorax sp. OK605]